MRNIIPFKRTKPLPGNKPLVNKLGKAIVMRVKTRDLTKHIAREMKNGR